MLAVTFQKLLFSAGHLTPKAIPFSAAAELCRPGKRFHLGSALFAFKANYFFLCVCGEHRVVCFSIRRCIWMVLNGRKQMTQFNKEEKISGISGLKQRPLLHVVMWKSLY